MKAFLIDPEHGTIAAIEIDRARFLETLYAQIDCQLVDVVAGQPIPGHDIWIDDEGALYSTPPHGLLAIPETEQQIFYGRAIVTGGPDDDGDVTGATCTAEDVAKHVFAVAALWEHGAIAAPLRVIETADNNQH